MVLADDNFATIVRFVREGRRIYDNIRRFVSYGLTGGSAEIWVMLLAPLFGPPLALLQLGVIYWPPAQAALDLQPLTLADLAIVLVASTATFWAIEAEKARRPAPRTTQLKSSVTGVPAGGRATQRAALPPDGQGYGVGSG
jgi:hypothetical protein